MIWNIEYHNEVKEDLKSIDNHDREIILKTIEKKLSFEPEKYGRPLRADLKRFWKLKIGDYRVVYKIEKAKVVVIIVAVGYRRDFEVYKTAVKRVH